MICSALTASPSSTIPISLIIATCKGSRQGTSGNDTWVGLSRHVTSHLLTVVRLATAASTSASTSAASTSGTTTTGLARGHSGQVPK